MELNEAIKRTIAKYGQDILTDSRLLSFLLDMQAFDDRPAAKHVLKTAQSDGYMAKLLAVGEWNMQSRKLMNDFASMNGFQGDVVQAVFEGVAYGLGWLQSANGRSEKDGSAPSSQAAKNENGGSKNSSGGAKNQGRPPLTFDESKLPPRLRIVIRQIVDNMVWVEGGTFTMGATPEQEPAYMYDLTSSQFDDEYPPHQVTLDSFFISKYLVTRREWCALMGGNENNNHPISGVSRKACGQFINKLEQLSGIKFRLPTEAEWEFAARGGNSSQHTMYAGSNDCFEVAYCSTIKRYSNKNKDVGEKKPNELGLYDMSGLVWEWCEDSYGPYSSTAVVNPCCIQGKYNDGVLHDEGVLRGGSWRDNELMCRTTTRSHFDTRSIIDDVIGFRLAL